MQLPAATHRIIRLYYSLNRNFFSFPIISYFYIMRNTASCRSYFFLLFMVTALAAGGWYLMVYQPELGMFVGGGLMVVVFIFIFYVNIPPVLHFMSERANDIENIYPDVSGKGLHIFSSFTVSRIKSGLCPLCTLQYYFLVLDTKNLYYEVLFSYEMDTAEGHSGYVDYSSFEEDVLPGEDLRKAMEKFSQKAGWPLKLGHAVRAGEDETYETPLGGFVFKIEKNEEMIQDTLRLCCYSEDGERLWRKTI